MENLKDQGLTKLPHDAVPIALAKTWTSNWRLTTKNSAFWANYKFNAFTIPLDDLTQISQEPNVVKARAYIGMTNPVTDNMAPGIIAEVKLILVGVDAQGKDLIDDNVYFAYDFSTPCPPTCDYTSVLMQ